MSDLVAIKERIYDEQKIETLLVELECQYVKDVGERYEAGLPQKFDSKNRRAVQVRKTEMLNSYIRNRGITGDIYSVVGYILYEAKDFEEVKANLYQIKAWICNTLGWSEYMDGRSTSEEKKVDPLAFLKPIITKRKQREGIEALAFKENKVISEDVLDWYFPYAHISFKEDGINYKTQKEFGIMFDRDSERVIYPIHNSDGQLIGVKGRYVGSQKSVMDNMKYLYLHRCDKSIELYNMHRALEHIKEAGEVIVFESAKSCMLAWQWGYKNTVSIEGNELTPVQAMMLTRLGVTIVYALDKDMKKEHVKKQSRQTRGSLCKWIYDKEDLLAEKHSPVDRGLAIWRQLYSKNKYIIK